MTGAESLVKTLVNGGVKVCFANPGTSEMHFVSAIDTVKGMRAVLCLFEGVCTGAADGYARMSGKPAATLLHLGPGLGNGLANLHNARRANSPMINIVGDHATYHLKHDAPLTSDIQGLAKTVSAWVRTSKDAAAVPGDAAEAVAAATKPPGQIATLILPADCSWNDSDAPMAAPQVSKPESVDPETILQAAGILRKKEPTVLLMAGPFLMEQELRAAGRISRASGARIVAQRVNGRMQGGAGRVKFERLPFLVEPSLKMLEGTAHLILIGARPPVSFFAWKNLPGCLTPKGCQVHTLSTVTQNGTAALEALAEELNAPEEPADILEFNPPKPPAGELTPEKVWLSLAAFMPAHAVISDEGVTSSRAADRWILGAPPHEWLSVTGGAIGQGMPVATGAAVACPERKVFSMQADGSGMYTLQSLWTQAREKLNVITVIFANRAYKILEGELERVGAQSAGVKARELLSLNRPYLDWVYLAKGMGVDAARVTTAEQFNRQLERAIAFSGPYLIEVVM